MNAANYYDIDSWEDSEAKRSLSRVRDRLLGRRSDGLPPKKRKGRRNKTAAVSLEEQMSNLTVEDS